mgnify:CR=1 FL=1
MEVPLSQMRPGQSGRVTKILGGRGMIMKLISMGIRPGAEVRKVAGMPLRGPTIIEIAGTTVAVGFGMAQRIIVEVGDEKDSSIR